MAKDDYYVVVYQILSYLYQRLKKGEDVEEKYLDKDSPLFGNGLHERYWKYIITNMYKQHFIEGLVIDEIDNATLIYKLEKTQITPLGIDYLCNNSTFEKAIKFLKDVKEIIPFT